jgi:hypothetical protein
MKRKIRRSMVRGFDSAKALRMRWRRLRQQHAFRIGSPTRDLAPLGYVVAR